MIPNCTGIELIQRASSNKIGIEKNITLTENLTSLEELKKIKDL